MRFQRDLKQRNIIDDEAQYDSDGWHRRGIVRAKPAGNVLKHICKTVSRCEGSGPVWDVL